MMTSSTARLLTPLGFNTLRNFLQTNRVDLAQSPILVIASEAGNSGPLPAVQQAVQHVQFTIAQQLGFRTVQATVSSAFPAYDDLEQKLELARRTGALSTIVAVGSGAAMDLAKAIGSSQNDQPRVILVPATYSAVMASRCSHSLFMDASEETLVPFRGKCNKNLVVALLEAKLVAYSVFGDAKNQNDASHAIYAALSISLDAWYQTLEKTPKTSINPQQMHEISALIQQLAAVVEQDRLPHNLVMDVLWQAGGLISYGLEDSNRSSPLALGASLLSPLFPQISLVTFIAGLLPGLCQLVLEQQRQGGLPSGALLDPMISLMLERLVTSSASVNSRPTVLPPPPHLTVAKEYGGFSVPDMSLSHLHSNQALWNSFDLPDALLTRILHDSLSVNE
jgi:hypothetical protein